jgi:hypothetical protein
MGVAGVTGECIDAHIAARPLPPAQSPPEPIMAGGAVIIRIPLCDE